LWLASASPIVELTFTALNRSSSCQSSRADTEISRSANLTARAHLTRYVTVTLPHHSFPLPPQTTQSNEQYIIHLGRITQQFTHLKHSI
jgi:hypothetical protein